MTANDVLAANTPEYRQCQFGTLSRLGAARGYDKTKKDGNNVVHLCSKMETQQLCGTVLLDVMVLNPKHSL